MKKLTLSEDLSLPIDVITQRISILGRTGSGKSHTAGVLVEEVLKIGQQVVIADPKGDWWGLRSSADGKRAGLTITIMGGEHGDLPLDPNAGSLVADIVINEGISVILDFSLFGSKAQEIRFMEAFCDRLYRKNKRPILFVCDEADIFAPQRPEKNETVMLNRMETLCRRGRSKGIGVVLISQRSASLHKGCLSQTELMIAHQTTAPQDKKAIEYWVVAHGDEEQHDFFMKTISKLQKGNAIAWSPSWLNIFKATCIRQKETYDSSATPRVGVRRKAPKVLAPVDLERLKKHMAETLEKARQEDPKLLRDEIRSLKAQLAGSKIQVVTNPKIDPDILRRELAAMKRSPATIMKPVEITKTISVKKPVIMKRELNRLEKLEAKLNDTLYLQSKTVNDIEGLIRSLTLKVQKAFKAQDEKKPEIVIPPPYQFQIMKNRPTPTIPLSKIPAGPAPSNEPIEKTVVDGERRILTALACFHPKTVTQSQLAVLCGIKATGSTMATYISRLKRRLYILPEDGDSFSITSEGSKFIGPPKEPLTPENVQAMWLGRFQKGPREILKIVLHEYTQPISLSAIAGALNVEENGSTLATYISRLRAAGLITVTKEGEKKYVKASKDLFEVGA